MTKTKKVILMSALVLLLAVTAVFNVLLATTEKTASADGVVTTANYFTSYRSERSSSRNEELLELDNIISLYDKEDAEYKAAVEMKMKIVNMMESELSIETMIKSLGFKDAVVSIGYDSENVNVFINSSELNYDTALSIYNLLKNETGVVAGNIIIMPVYSES